MCVLLNLTFLQVITLISSRTSRSATLFTSYTYIRLSRSICALFFSFYRIPSCHQLPRNETKYVVDLLSVTSRRYCMRVQVLLSMLLGLLLFYGKSIWRGWTFQWHLSAKVSLLVSRLTCMSSHISRGFSQCFASIPAGSATTVNLAYPRH